jgi:hypothetical protein
MTATRKHILIAGREIMLAARGALRFFRSFAQSAATPSVRPFLLELFDRAIDIADDFSAGLIKATEGECS